MNSKDVVVKEKTEEFRSSCIDGFLKNPYFIGMQMVCFFNIFLSGIFLFVQAPAFLELESANGFVNKNKPSSGLINGMSAAQVACIVLSLVWWVKTILFKSDSYWTRQLLVVVQVLFVLDDLVLTLMIDKNGGFGAVLFDGLRLVPAVKYANFLK